MIVGDQVKTKGFFVFFDASLPIAPKAFGALFVGLRGGSCIGLAFLGVLSASFG